MPRAGCAGYERIPSATVNAPCARSGRRRLLCRLRHHSRCRRRTPQEVSSANRRERFLWSPAADARAPKPRRARPVRHGLWTSRARDRRFPQLASCFNAQVAAGICSSATSDPQLVRLSPNEARAKQVAGRLDAFKSIPMPTTWARARELQLLLGATRAHRRVPPVDLLIGSAAEAAGVPLVHLRPRSRTPRRRQRAQGTTGSCPTAAASVGGSDRSLGGTEVRPA